ncbi:hypothetical protein [Flexithrix dorotheae]|uniref:hypothetical protein n=1 Tax=Flexithrix dorotheae TaxID=70993 RepID=UPI000371DE30|nr:hypothetical protein [Flexithrix dorotheae]
MNIKKFTTLLFFVCLISISKGASIDISKASIIISNDIKPKVRQSAVRILQEEISQRSGMRWKEISQWKDSKQYTIALVLASTENLDDKTPPARDGKKFPENQPEGFRILLENKTIWIIGADSRAVIFGIGELLRHSTMKSGKFLIDENLDISTSPQYSLRGHQIGYRNTANSYDAWSVEQYDQYIRDLVLFGTNAIENIPPLGKDKSPHFKISREEMNIKMSEICDAYDIEYWVWTPATVDLKEPDLYQAQLKLHEANYKEVPRLDNVFFPGGDPGHNHPREVMPFLKELHSKLIQYHPEAGIWISLQGFSQEQIDYFYQYLDLHKPTWLRGVVSGPSSPSISETRYRLPKQYKHRHYPDITHNVRCDYPALNFDQAFALTIGREGINPQPVYYGKVHAKYAPFTDGFVSYSDGCHDDVNKIIWSQRGWDPDKNIQAILKEYSKFFFLPELEEKASDGILGLEKNWDGPILENGNIGITMNFWKNLEKEYPQLSKNWRWQMLVLRAYYDDYVAKRKINESNLEKKANKILLSVDEIGATAAMKEALEIVNKADNEPIETENRQKIETYCKMLFESIGLQTSVEKYQGSGAQRGCILDFVDYPLNNRWWLSDQFDSIHNLSSEAEKATKIKNIANWENPGPGGYYDDVSNVANSPHVTTTVYDAVDFGWWDGGLCRWRLSSQVYQNDPILEYEDLDPNGRYMVRVAGYGDALIRVDGVRLDPLVYHKEIEGFKEFIVPKHVVGDGTLTITFDRPEESHLNWRNQSRVSDVWLIKK